MNIHFFKKPTIYDQLQIFLIHKRNTKGLSVSVCHKEWLVKFVSVIKRESVHDIDVYDVLLFKEWVLDHYAGDFLNNEAIHSVRCFLRFFKRYDILNHMANTGRKPNLKMVGEVQEYRGKKLSFRDIQALYKRRGKKYDLKTLQFWANYPK